MNKVIKKSILLILLSFCLFPNSVMGQQTGMLESISVQEFLKFPSDMQTIYIAGILDGMAFSAYAYSLDYPKWAECVRAKNLGDTTNDVVNFIKADQNFNEGVNSATAQMLGKRCKH